MRSYANKHGNNSDFILVINLDRTESKLYVDGSDLSRQLRSIVLTEATRLSGFSGKFVSIYSYCGDLLGVIDFSVDHGNIINQLQNILTEKED